MLSVERVLLAGGGTGGHLYPALSVAQVFNEQDSEILFLGTTHGLGASVVPSLGYPIRFIRARGLEKGLAAKFRFALDMSLGLLQSIGILASYRPQVVIGSGGYVCVPAILAAYILGIPSVIMEQNALSGKAVRFLSRFVDKVCVSFPETCKDFPSSKVVLTGNPVRKEIPSYSREEARHQLKIPADRKCLFIAGASQGASSINAAVLKALPKWKDENWTVIHLTGPKHIQEILVDSRNLVENATLDYRPLGYLDNMAMLYAASDLFVSRAGATTLAEVTARGIPSILVPYPFAAENHQMVNAKAMQNAGAADIVPDDMIGERLADIVSQYFNQPEKLKIMAEKSRALGVPNAADAVAKLAASLVKRR